MTSNRNGEEKRQREDELRDGCDVSDWAAAIENTQFGGEMLKLFPLDPRKAHLNHGSYGSAPKYVEMQRVKRMAEVNANPDLFFRWTVDSKLHEAHAAVCEYLHLPPKNLVFVENATTGINTVLKSLTLGPGDAILTYEHTFIAVGYTCASVCAHNGCRRLTVPLRLPAADEPLLTADEIVEVTEKTLDLNRNVRIAIIDVISSASAIQFPVLRLIDACRKRGVLTLVDGAHAPGHVSNELVEQICERADFFVGNLHKWFFASRPCGFLLVSPQFQTQVEPLVTSWYYAKAVAGDWQAPFFMLATHDWTAQFSVLDAIEFCVRAGGIEAIQEYNQKLADAGQQLFRERLGTQFFPARLAKEIESPFMRNLMLPNIFQAGEGKSPYSIASKRMKWLFEQQNVMVQFSVCPGGVLSVRTSAQCYNTLDDFARAADALLAYRTHMETDGHFARKESEWSDRMQRYFDLHKKDGFKIIHESC